MDSLLNKFTSQRWIVCLVLPFSCTLTASVDILPSQQGFSGLIFTPNAQSLEAGRGSAALSKGAPLRGRIEAIDNWYFSAGVFSGLEFGTRISESEGEYTSNCYVEGCDLRDLSATAKFQAPYLEDIAGFNLAFGVQDIGGALSYFDAYFVVADTEIEALNLRVNGGYGKSELSLGILDGPFAGAEWQPFEFVQLTGEYDAQEFNAAVRVITPRDLLPYGAQISAQYQLYSGHNNQDQTLWGASVSVPLLGYTSNRQKYSNVTPDTKKQLLAKVSTRETGSLAQLIGKLEQEGFVNIRLGSNPNTLIVALENRRYNHNQVDGLGVAMGIIFMHFGQHSKQDLRSDFERVELIMLANQKPVVAVNADIACYQSFIVDGENCNDINFNTKNLLDRLDLVEWTTKSENIGSLNSQLVLSPMVRHGIGTEYGFYDYSLAVSSNLYTYLWPGAAIDVRHILPLAESDDFEEGGYFEDSAYENEIDRAMVHQFFRLPYVDIANQVSLGLVKSDYIGARSESAWFSQSGNHELGLEMSYFQHQDEKDKNGYANPDRQTFLTRYTFSMPEWDWQFNATAGEFWKGDVGAKLSTSHWLGDVELSASYQITKFTDTDEEQFVTLSVKLPLTPWRDMAPGIIQVRGNEAYDYNLTTRVSENKNYLSSGQGDELIMDNSMLRRYFNRGRYGSDYFEENLNRMHNAYLRYLRLQLD